MKKITFLFSLILGTLTMSAQTDCNSATSITDGTYTVNSVNGTAPTTNCANYNPATNPPNAGVWYSYSNTEAQDKIVTVSTDIIANLDNDTKVSIVSGTCSNLTCVANNDDVDFGNGNYLSEVEFLAAAGESYFIVFDATWENTGFDFEVSSSFGIPNAPGMAISPNPADASTVFLSSGTNQAGEPVQQYLFTWDLPATSENASSYIFDLGIDNTVSQFTTTVSGNSLLLSGLQLSSTYFWRITSQNPGGDTVGTVWSFSTESTLGSEDFEVVKTLEHFMSNNVLTINSNQSIDQVAIYNMLGQVVKTTQPASNTTNINLSEINKGIYIAKVEIAGQTQTFKFVK